MEISDMANQKIEGAPGRWAQFHVSQTGVLLHSILTGVGGVAILLIFFSMALSAGAVFILLPVIIVFNATSAGYGLADKWPVNSGKKAALIAVALILAVTGYLGSIMLFPWEKWINEIRIIINCIAALVGVFLGSWITAKKRIIESK